jgi:glycine/D-amino acid oxidase-like deaminating enzyme
LQVVVEGPAEVLVVGAGFVGLALARLFVTSDLEAARAPEAALPGPAVV